nr:putative late blight resistance protein homolog R1C-3 isoform X1 [Ipomoea batatas]
MVREIEEVEERMLMVKKETGLLPHVEKNITVCDTYQSALKLENEVIVGIDIDIEMIVDRLCYSHFMRSIFTILRNNNIHKFRKYVENPVLKLQVIPLIGEGGIGKTTLAKRVYGHPITIASFDIRAWVVLPQVPSLKEILIGLLRCISPITSEIYTLDNAQIAEQLCTNLRGKKYLICLDDIWTIAAWDAIKGYFPENFNGSRILVTTRFREVSEYLSTNPYQVGYFMDGKCPLQLPCDILDLRQLRYLHVDKRCSEYLPCLVKNNLQTLYWLKVASSDEKPNFRMVPNLRELGIFIEGQLAPSYLGSLVYLRLLEKLKFEVGRVERFYLPTGFPPNLKKLTLRCTYLPWKEMDTIAELPHLEVLKLKDFAFCGSEWKLSTLHFPKLKALLISRSNLKHWNTTFNHFPVLERLVLRYCWELKQIPMDILDIGTLKLIVLECCCYSLVTSAKHISLANELLYWGLKDCPVRVRKVATKVKLLNNESFEEIVVNSEEENVESVKSSKEESVGSSKQ